MVWIALLRSLRKGVTASKATRTKAHCKAGRGKGLPRQCGTGKQAIRSALNMIALWRHSCPGKMKNLDETMLLPDDVVWRASLCALTQRSAVYILVRNRQKGDTKCDVT